MFKTVFAKSKTTYKTSDLQVCHSRACENCARTRCCDSRELLSLLLLLHLYLCRLLLRPLLRLLRCLLLGELQLLLLQLDQLFLQKSNTSIISNLLHYYRKKTEVKLELLRRNILCQTLVKMEKLRMQLLYTMGHW